MAESEGSSKSKKNQYRKDKPWDSEDIDHWKVEPLKPEEVNPVVDESSFATLFPKYREQYLKEVWSHVTRALDKHHIECELNLVEGSMTVRTTPKTFDPFIVLKARDMLKLLARSVPFPQAVKILNDDVNCDIVKIGNIVRNRERFVKRRQRLVGPNGNTLKALEILTGCYMLVQGNTVSVMGSYKGLKIARRIIVDCLNNVHPIYAVKELMIKRELEKDETLKNESWDRFLPHFKKRSANVKAKSKQVKKKVYTPFPPEQTPRKVDLEMESGEYFLKPAQKMAKKMEAKKQAQIEASQEKRARKEQSFIPPEEPIARKATPAASSSSDVSMEELKQKFQAQGNQKRTHANATQSSVSDFVDSAPKQKKSKTK